MSPVEGWLCGGMCLCSPEGEVICKDPSLYEAPRFDVSQRIGKDLFMYLDSSTDFLMASLEHTLGFRTVVIKGGEEAFCKVS